MHVKALNNWTEIRSKIIVSNIDIPRHFISAEKTYVVYGMSWPKFSRFYGRALLCEIIDDDGDLVSIPLDFFEITDSNIPNIWRAESRDGSFFMWPEVFYQEYFFDDLSSGSPEAVDAFMMIRKNIEQP